MATAGNVKEILANLEFESIDEMINEIYEKLQLSVAIFDGDGVLQGLCMSAQRCKCYYMLLHSKPNQCSIFNPDFTKGVLAEHKVDKLCDFSCRLTSREMDICGEPHKIIIFQYNLDDDSLEFNPTNDPKFTPLYKGDPTAVDYFWKPNVLDKEEREYIFNWVRTQAERIKSFY
jgi:hypothetical protein